MSCDGDLSTYKKGFVCFVLICFVSSTVVNLDDTYEFGVVVNLPKFWTLY